MIVHYLVLIVYYIVLLLHYQELIVCILKLEWGIAWTKSGQSVKAGAGQSTRQTEWDRAWTNDGKRDNLLSPEHLIIIRRSCQQLESSTSVL